MIRVSNIHTDDHTDPMYEDNIILESCIEEISFLYEKYNDSKIFGESSFETTDVMTEGVKSAIERFGDAIKSIIDKCLDFIKSIVEKFQKFLWDKKDKDKMLEKLAKENPEKASKIETMIEAGKISYTDFRNISDFYKNIDGVIKEIEKGDAKSAKGKLLKAKDAVVNAKDVLITTGAVASAATTITLGINQIINWYRRRRPANDQEIKDIREFARENGLKIKNITRSTTISNDKNGNPVRKTNINAQYESVQAFFENGASDTSELMSVSKELANLFSKYSNKFIKERISASTKIYSIADRMQNSLKGGN